MDWHHSYMEHQRTVASQLRDARASRVPVLRLASGSVRPEKLSDRAIADVALRDAEVIVNQAIHQHNAELARKARK